MVPIEIEMLFIILILLGVALGSFLVMGLVVLFAKKPMRGLHAIVLAILSPIIGANSLPLICFYVFYPMYFTDVLLDLFTSIDPYTLIVIAPFFCALLIMDRRAPKDNSATLSS